MKISIYITSYNQKELLCQAINSVLNQTLQPFEVIIVDDASSDGSVELIKSYVAKYPKLIRCIFNNINEGVSRVRIKALESVLGDYVSYLDGDDLYLPQKLEKEARLIEGGQYDLVFSNNAYFKQSPTNIQKIWLSDIKDLPNPGNMYLETFCRLFPNDSLFRMELVNYSLLKSVGFHDKNLKIYEDYELRVRLSKIAKINYTLEPLALVRQDSHTLSKSPRQVHLDALRYIFDKHRSDVLDCYPMCSSFTRHRINKFSRKKYLSSFWKALSRLESIKR